MSDLKYPALYELADENSASKQNWHVGLIAAEYSLLLIAALFSMSFLKGFAFSLIYAIVFIILILVLLVRAYLRPVQDWYRFRALAESVKTLSWRYMMKAPPFDKDGARIEFAKHLADLLQAYKDSAGRGGAQFSQNKQITESMEAVRNLGLTERKEYYRRYRIIDQQVWYDNKARVNRAAGRRCVIIGVASYILAAIFVWARVYFEGFDYWPIEPVIVFASSLIGWMQLKKYGELAAAYQVAGQEISIIESALDEHVDEKSVADFVNDAEHAFSREHTMWAARNSA
ncbi:DUF4231 domain-containing protein [Stutzerimonas stutzeri]|uniref:DUF4231 domain-containing protein n=1 Tax=Stutzerimonas stutzeri TaxID=316 RepID=UPI0015E2A3C9|nr:DUF4231 domain-containing protein [Stutzerimonas stutzeri]